jgi:NDP-sugar pyrophosphorylase family protein
MGRKTENKIDYFHREETSWYCRMSSLSQRVIFINTFDLSKQSLRYLGEEDFFMLNSDVICEFPFEMMLKSHKRTGAEATVLTTKVL